jgi:Thymidine kinase
MKKNAKLVFRYATMGSGKSLEIIQIQHNYKRCEDKHGLIMVSSIDTRGAGQIWTRIGISVPATVFDQTDNLFELIKKEHEKKPLSYVIIDEANFLKKEQVDQLGDVADFLKIDVLAYGILTDFQTNLFEGSKRLLEIAEEKTEISVRTICWCGKKATHHGRVIDGQFVAEGDVICIDEKDDDGKEREIQYVSLCRLHHKLKQWHK